MLTVSSARAKGALALIGMLFVAIAIPAHAQQGESAPANQDEINKQLRDHIQELEKEIQQIKGQQTATPPSAPPPPPPEPAAEVPVVNEVAPRLKLTVFGDVGAQSFTHIPYTFLFGSLDLFMRARLSDKVSALGEVLFIAQSDNNIEPDVERLLLSYRQNDYFSISVG